MSSRDSLGGEREVQPAVYCAGVSCIAAVVLLLSSFALVHPTQYGLRINYINMRVAPEPWGPGRHLIGPWQGMILFPSTVRNVEFSARGSGLANAPALRTRTSEGLDLTIHVSFQYKLKDASLYELYVAYKQNYQSVFQRQAAAILLSVASQYRADQYWTERPEIGEAMRDGLSVLFEEYAEVTQLELMIIGLPSNFEEKIVATQEAKQIFFTREAEQAAAVVRVGIDVMLAGYKKEEQIILNNATAEAMLLTQTATAQAQASRLQVETIALLEVAERIKLTSAGQVSYQRGIAYQSIPNSQFMFGVQQAAAIVNTASSFTSDVHETAKEVACGLAESADVGIVPRATQPARMLTENVEETPFNGLPSETLKAVVEGADVQYDMPIFP